MRLPLLLSTEIDMSVRCTLIDAPRSHNQSRLRVSGVREDERSHRAI